MEKVSRHKSSTPEQLAKERRFAAYAKILIIVSALMFIPYYIMEFFPFVRSIYVYNKINVTTMCYTVLRLLLTCVPVIIALPETVYHKIGLKMKKIAVLSKWFLLLGAVYFAGTMTDIMTYNIFADYKDTGEDPIMLKMLWGSTNIIGLLLCIIQGAGYLSLFKNIKGHKKNIIITLGILYAVYLLAPIAVCILMQGSFNDAQWGTWLDKNIWFHLSNVFLILGLIVAAQSRRSWSNNIWQ